MREMVLRVGILGLIGLAAWWDRVRISKTSGVGPVAIVSPLREAAGSDPRKGLARKGTDPVQRREPAARQLTSTEKLHAITKRQDLLAGLTASIPAPEKLIVGTTRAALERQYGKPTFDVVARRNGSLVERYFYVSRDQAHITVATLQDGRITSAASIPR